MASPAFAPAATSRRRIAQRALVKVFCLALMALAYTSAQAAPPAAPTEQEIIRGIDAAVAARTHGIAGYTVQELYAIYRNGESSPSVKVTVQTTYNRTTGKDYTPVSSTGSSLLRKVVIDHILAEEKEMATAANRESVAVTSANYQMRPIPGTVDFAGRRCVVVELKARRKTPFLLNGKGWFDAADYTLVHLEGAPAESPSFFAGQTAGHRDYGKIDGYSMAQRAEMHSHSFLFGNSLLTIDYTNYRIQLDPATPQTATP